MTVDVKKVADRRKVRFANLQEVVADAERLATGPVRMLGNKSYEEILRHLALVMNGSIDNPTSALPVPWYIRMVARPLRGRFFAKGLNPGFRLPAGSDAKAWPSNGDVQEALAELRKAVRRLETESQRGAHPAFGKLTIDEWNQFHLRHSELHLSFATPA